MMANKVVDPTTINWSLISPVTKKLTANNVSSGSINSLTNTAQSNEVFITGTKKQSSPADLKDLQKWVPYKGLIDPNASNTSTTKLTRMHQINGVLHGPSDASNMFLGSQRANNSSSDSHLHSVEVPIKQGVSNGYYCYYEVQPEFYTTPPYLFNRMKAAHDDASTTANGKAKVAEFSNWVDQACPGSFNCNVTWFKPTAKVDEYCIAQTQFINIEADKLKSTDNHPMAFRDEIVKIP
ncbi:hypothetical protein A7985_07795 [Pseudoalteromonas luteoviolacea]|uniref:Uncharacterized protein n=1 Tax=Pseudoalteromonas luteoviolacea TaxID=43657 RepID=A0A1C0TWZ0_9GAMM|nr:hypothetical protein [Pseudoalteromonas luteoviolacea]OCQ23831.1 hypothetical protein A7985_07795 [Pseudoalteromonas luteoviolacea]